MTEKWRPVVGYEGLYEVSDQGRVRSVTRVIPRARTGPLPLKGRVLVPSRGEYHSSVKLCRRGVGKTQNIHALVAQAFIGPRPIGLEICHNNGDGHDNRLVNLRYDTSSANKIDVITHGHHRANWTHCPSGHEYTPENTMLRPNGARRCRQCHVEGQRRRYLARKSVA